MCKALTNEKKNEQLIYQQRRHPSIKDMCEWLKCQRSTAAVHDHGTYPRYTGMVITMVHMHDTQDGMHGTNGTQPTVHSHPTPTIHPNGTQCKHGTQPTLHSHPLHPQYTQTVLSIRRYTLRVNTFAIHTTYSKHHSIHTLYTHPLYTCCIHSRNTHIQYTHTHIQDTHLTRGSHHLHPFPQYLVRHISTVHTKEHTHGTHSRYTP